MPVGAGALVGEALLARGEDVPGANGAIGPATELCEAVARARGRSVVTDMALRLHRLVELTAPEGVAGHGRAAAADDADLLATWRMAFHREAHSGSGALEENDEQAAEAVRRSIAAGTTWVWEDAAGEVVCYVGANPPAYGVARVGPVYTPPAHRRHGYAAACTALASAALRDEGADEVCLFTDLANPTSNGVYLRIGYRPVDDTANLRLV
jgi:predicted GNAT family acetyltransferase